MSTGTLTEWLKRTYASFKQASDVPDWVLPDRSFSDVVDEAGENDILKIGRPLKAPTSTKKKLEGLPEPSVASEVDVQDAVASWALMPRVKPIVEACLDARVILEKVKSGELKADANVCCTLSVLSIAAFTPRGQSLLVELASILGGDKDQPDDLIKRYVDAVLHNDGSLLKSVADCVSSHEDWRKWSNLFAKKAMSFQSEPKLIAVTPASSTDIVWLLAQMLKEGGEDESR
jgi:hypothetical protein